MKKSNKIVMLIALVLCFTINMSFAQKIKNRKTETVKVFGNCGSCKKNIETAAFKKKASRAIWNAENNTAILNYDSTKTTADAVLKNIALAGYDNQNYMAPESAYNKLAMCCQYDRKKSSREIKQPGGDANMNMNEMHDDMNTTEVKNPPTNTSATQNQNLLTDVYASYFGLKDALTKDDGETAAAKAKELFTSVDLVPMEKLIAAQQTVWMKYMKDISYNAEHIKATTETEHQREHFAKLSAAMIEVMKIIKPDYTIYLDHCPMYNSGKGADWLSKESGIKNPYYGKQMLTCGSTKETITK